MKRDILRAPWRLLPNGCYVTRLHGHELGVCHTNGNNFVYTVVSADHRDTALSFGGGFKTANAAAKAAFRASSLRAS